jgi:hypothetical protein
MWLFYLLGGVIALAGPIAVVLYLAKRPMPDKRRR